MDTPSGQFERELGEALYGRGPRTRATMPADIEELDAARALAFHQARFGDVADFTSSSSATWSSQTLRPLVETWLGSLPGAGRREVERDRGVRMRVGAKTWRLGQAPQASVQLWFSGTEAWTRDHERDMHILSEVLSRRLRTVLREELGGVYGVSASGGVARRPHEWFWSGIRFGCAPDKVEALIAAALAVIDAVAKDGPTPEELARIRETTLREREVYLRENSFWLSSLGSAYRFGDEATLILDPGPLLARLTADDVRAAATPLPRQEACTRAVLLPAPTR